MRLSTTVVLLIFVAAGGVAAETRFSVGPIVQRVFGEAEYEQALVFDYGLGISDEVRSLLEYPLDVTSAGGEARLAVARDSVIDWFFTVRGVTNLSDPGGVMKDHDWLRLVGVVDDKVGYTESDADAQIIQFDIEARRRVAGAARFALMLYAGFRYQRIEQTMVGFDGWYLDTNFVRVSASSEEPALFYRVRHATPMVGLSPVLTWPVGLRLEGLVALGPDFFSDLDDHLLREFTQSASGMGWAGRSTVELRYGAGALERGWFLQLRGDLYLSKADDQATREYYGDDPGTTEDDTGQILPGLPHDVRSTQFGIGVSAGWGF